MREGTYERDIYSSTRDFPLPVEVVDSDVDLYYRIALSMYLEVEAANGAAANGAADLHARPDAGPGAAAAPRVRPGRGAGEPADGDAASARRDCVFIVPVGPVFQYRRFVWLVKQRPIDLSRLHLFFMDEYLDEQGGLIPEDSPLSFRGFIQRELIEPMGSTGGFSGERVYFPDPQNPGDFDRRLAELGGADVCYAGVGINGHLAFNEPEGALSAEDFLQLGTRVVPLSRETITINSNTALRGAFEQVPARAITVGFRQIMEARKLRIYLNRPWQGAVVRKLLFGDISPSFPASFARRHSDAALIMTPEVAERPSFALK